MPVIIPLKPSCSSCYGARLALTPPLSPASYHPCLPSRRTVLLPLYSPRKRKHSPHQPKRMGSTQALPSVEVNTKTVTSSQLDVGKTRAQFAFFQPELKNPVFLDNAGGSQVPIAVADRIRDYYLYNYVQLGAPYDLSCKATSIVEAAHEWMKIFMNANGVGEVVLGNSTSQLLSNLADSYARVLSPGDELIVEEACHESNIGPWIRAAERSGATLKMWRLDPTKCSCPISWLKQSLTPATKIVAITHVSNVLGDVRDVAEIVKVVKSVAPRARVVVDGVAYAPHLAIDVKAWGVDWYVFSTYKTWGPHMAALFGSYTAVQALGSKGAGLNHFFVPDSAFPYKFELGGVNHEGCAGLLALQSYMQFLSQFNNIDASASSGTHTTLAIDPKKLDTAYLSRDVVESAYNVIADAEQQLQSKLLEYMQSKPDLVLLGSPVAEKGKKVPTISFFHKHKSSKALALALVEQGLALRHGHFYAYRLVEALCKHYDKPMEEGAVRVSLLHYNTMEEMDKLIQAFEEVL